MAEQDSGEKTEQPTDKKQKDAKEKGQTAQSKELTAIAAIIVIALAFGSNYQYNLRTLANSAIAVFSDFYTSQDSQYSVITALYHVLSVGVKIFLFPIVLAAVISFFVSVGQIGGIVLNKEGLKFDIAKLNPIENFKNTFSKKNFVKFVRQFFEIFIMVVVAYVMCKYAIVYILMFPYVPLPRIVSLMSLFLFKLFAVLFGIHIVFSIIDYVLEKINLKKQLMMSMHDIKEEQKETDGNPEIKQKRRELHRELLQDEEAFGGFIGSGILFANPTHIAVFVIFIPGKLKLPAIVLMETDEKALSLIKLAEKLKIPVIRDVWLARKLYEIGKINSYVPASILSFVADAFGKNMKLLPGVVNAIKAMKIPTV
jgi:type III secretion protein U